MLHVSKDRYGLMRLSFGGITLHTLFFYFYFVFYFWWLLRKTEIILVRCYKAIRKCLLALLWLTLSCYIKSVLLTPLHEFADLGLCCAALLIIREDKCARSDQGMAAVNVILPGGKGVRPQWRRKRNTGKGWQKTVGERYNEKYRGKNFTTNNSAPIWLFPSTIPFIYTVCIKFIISRLAGKWRSNFILACNLIKMTCKR